MNATETTTTGTTAPQEKQRGMMVYRPTATQKTKDAPPDSDGEPIRSKVDGAGLVAMDPEKRIADVPLYYYSDKGRWYGPNGHGGFSNMTDAAAKALVAEHGLSRSQRDETGNSKADRATLWLMQHRSVAYAGLVAGYPAGIHDVEGTRILVTESSRCIEPGQGDFPTIRRLVETMLADDSNPQISCFYLWCAASYRTYSNRMLGKGDSSNWPFRHCPALAIFGPRKCGKTALIDLVIGPLFGGRKADPMNFLRDPKFNKDLVVAPILVLDDKGASSSLADRRQRGEGIKDLIWKPEQRMEGKGADAVMLRPFWRLIIAGNDDDAGLQVCPALSPSLTDKLIILKAREAQGLPSTDSENDEWKAAITRELPAFASFLLGWEPPEGTQIDPRSRVMNFWHPEIVDALREMQPEMRLLDLIDSLKLISPQNPHWEGTSGEFEDAMRQVDKERLLDRIFVTGTSAGRMLSELSRMTNRVKKTNRHGRSYYRILPPPPVPSPPPS